MPQDSSLKVTGRIEDWWESAKGDLLTDPFGPMAKAGLFQIGLPGADTALDSYRAIAVAEQAIALKSGLLGLASAFAARQMAARFFIAGFANQEQRAAWLPRIAAGEVCTAIAISEPGAGAHPKHLKTTAESRGAGFVVQRRQGLGHQWPGRGSLPGAGGGRRRGWPQALRPVHGPEGNGRPVDKADEGARRAVAGDALRAGIRWLRAAGVGAARRYARRLSGHGLAVSRCRGHRRHGQCFGAAGLAAREDRRADRAHRGECAAARPHRRPGVAGAGGKPARGGKRSTATDRMFRRG